MYVRPMPCALCLEPHSWPGHDRVGVGVQQAKVVADDDEPVPFQAQFGGQVRRKLPSGTRKTLLILPCNINKASVPCL